MNRTLQLQVNYADAKLSGLIGFSATFGALLLATRPSFHPSSVPNPFESLVTLLAYVPPGTYLLTLLSFLIAIICAGIGFYSGSERDYQENVVFWRWIERQPLDKYQREVNALTESAVEDAYAKENHRLSKRLWWKDRFIQYAATAFLLGLLFGLASSGASLLVK